MGNSKSKKVKISDAVPPKDEESTERINSIKPDIAEAVSIGKTTNLSDKIDENQHELDANLDKVRSDNDNQSSASTVEVLDDNDK